MHIQVYSVGTKATRRKAAVHYASHFLSRGNLKNLMQILHFCVGPCESYFFVRIESRIESAVYTTQAVTQPDGLQAYRTGL